MVAERCPVGLPARSPARRAKARVPRVGGSRRSSRREDGQATVELVAAVPALLLAALISLQLLAAGYALTLADGAAEAGALALAEGGSAADAARSALPGWAEDDVSVSVEGEEVSVRLRPPSPFGSIADHLAVTSSASAKAAE
jgi:Flp pilus assembly protein TadG